MAMTRPAPSIVTAGGGTAQARAAAMLARRRQGASYDFVAIKVEFAALEDFDPALAAAIKRSLDAALSSLQRSDLSKAIGDASSDLDEVVRLARKSKKLEGVPIDFKLAYPLEQLWVARRTGEIVHVPTKAAMYKDSCGNTLGKNEPASAVPGDVSAVIHTHPEWGYAWPAAGDYTSAQKYDVYNINRAGTWVLRKGTSRGSPPVTLSGSAPSVPPSGNGASCR